MRDLATEKLDRIRKSNQAYYDAQSNTKEVDKLSEDVEKTRTLIIKSMHGLGDNINQRAFIKELGREVYLDTPWPELYSDLPYVKIVKCDTMLRTQVKNIKRQAETIYSTAPTKDLLVLKVFYTTRDLQTGSQLKRFWQQFGVKPKVFDLPDFGRPDFLKLVPPGMRVAVIRPATIRKEWMAASRNPDPAYLAQAAITLMQQGYFVISVADTEPGVEWIIGDEPPADLKFHRGELMVTQLLGLCQNADALVGGHGWLTHFAMSAKKKALIIMGGYGGDNSPAQIADPDFIDNSCITFILPDNYCKCTTMIHPCIKTITGFEDKVRTWIRGL